MNTLLRSIVFLGVGLVLVIFFDIAGVRLAWHIDLAWLLVVAAAFAWPDDVAPLAGVLFGLTRDGLSGDSALMYAISYGGFGLIVLLIRRAFFLRGFFSSWIVAVAGAELLWLFIGAFSQALILLGSATRTPGWFSPFLPAAFFLYPPIYLLTIRFLRPPIEPQRGLPYFGDPKIHRI